MFIIEVISIFAQEMPLSGKFLLHFSILCYTEYGRSNVGHNFFNCYLGSWMWANLDVVSKQQVRHTSFDKRWRYSSRIADIAGDKLPISPLANSDNDALWEIFER